jgi:flagellar operon protein (TIGR03826 family)
MGMALANCKECGRLFNMTVRDVCQLCVEKEEQDFEKVYTFLRNNGSSHIDIIHKDTGVDKKRLMRFLAEGRFEGVTITYKCDSCGEPITNGKLCSKCVEKITADIEKLQNKPNNRRDVGESSAFLGQTSLDRYRRK